MTGLIKKSAAAALMIALGDYVLLKMGNPLGPILFALGLLGVCFLELNLFTGKCGFLFESKLKLQDLMIILAGNLVAGYLAGLFFSFLDADVVQAAAGKVASWDFSFAFFGKAVLCGAIMYVAVKIFKKDRRWALCSAFRCLSSAVSSTASPMSLHWVWPEPLTGPCSWRLPATSSDRCSSPF